MVFRLTGDDTQIYLTKDIRHTFLRLLAAQMGVGGDDSWGAPVHEQYQLPADRAYTLDVNLELF